MCRSQRRSRCGQRRHCFSAILVTLLPAPTAPGTKQCGKGSQSWTGASSKGLGRQDNRFVQSSQNMLQSIYARGYGLLGSNKLLIISELYGVLKGERIRNTLLQL